MRRNVRYCVVRVSLECQLLRGVEIIDFDFVAVQLVVVLVFVFNLVFVFDLVFVRLVVFIFDLIVVELNAVLFFFILSGVLVVKFGVLGVDQVFVIAKFVDGIVSRFRCVAVGAV